MKKLIVFCSMALVVASASAYMVNTTFEAGSAGAGTWDTGTDVNGVPNLYAKWDEKDIASGVNWTTTAEDQHAGFGGYGGGVAYSGDQCGRICCTSGGAKSANLDFGNGENTDTYTMHWYAKQTMQGTGGHVYDNSRVRIRDDAAKTAAQISMYNDKATGTDSYGICYAVGGGGLFNKLMDMDYGTWYEFELVLKYGDKKFDFKAREAGVGAAWTGVTDKAFYESASSSFDLISCITDKGAESCGYWDDITVVPEPATMLLLGLGGGLLTLKRRRN
ncbi:MAG: PEP-CTERM sorting domain-containing protein [Anaerohalosphaeraceae bacterium]|nr:PEP-CTERM sorting domain-containing protein [Anaerohalosphaeraceae bacterium]